MDERALAIRQRGEQYLQVLGLEAHAETVIQTETGPIEARDFLLICGRHVIAAFKGYEQWVKDGDPRAEMAREELRQVVLGRLGLGNTEAQ